MEFVEFGFVLLTGLVLAAVSVAQRDCDPAYDFACSNGQCLGELQWCDSVPDCIDGSDERYCDGVTPCLDTHFRCGSGKCIPSSGWCNGYDDCGDFSDEINCALNDPEAYAVETEVFKTPRSRLEDETTRGRVVKQVLAKVVKYFMEEDASHGWGSFTPRAAVAMSLASRISQVDEQEQMKKKLNVQLLLDLLESEDRMTLGRLALYINALYATCQDPRNFQGVDLVARLRSDVDAAVRSNSSIPLPFVTLCLADELKERDEFALKHMFYRREFNRTGSRALIMMAMVCYAKSVRNAFKDSMQEFFSDNRLEIADVYSKALYMQASIAAGKPISLDQLTNEQLSDGSFGDRLATYYATPVLVHSSLLDLKCNITTDTDRGNSVAKLTGEKNVDYSLWISNDGDAGSHSLTIAFDGNKNFFEIMQMAAAKDPIYRFLYDTVNDEKMVYSIAGIPNDAESGKSWMLYRGRVNHVKVNSVEGLQLLPIGVDRIPADDATHFVFWFRKSLPAQL